MYCMEGWCCLCGGGACCAGWKWPMGGKFLVGAGAGGRRVGGGFFSILKGLVVLMILVYCWRGGTGVGVTGYLLLLVGGGGME